MAHFMNGIMHVSWSIIPDFAHCNLPLNFGCSKGHGAGQVAVQNATQAADRVTCPQFMYQPL